MSGADGWQHWCPACGRETARDASGRCLDPEHAEFAPNVADEAIVVRGTTPAGFKDRELELVRDGSDVMVTVKMPGDDGRRFAAVAVSLDELEAAIKKV